MRWTDLKTCIGVFVNSINTKTIKCVIKMDHGPAHILLIQDVNLPSCGFINFNKIKHNTVGCAGSSAILQYVLHSRVY